ncbi:MAG: hypothetical protein ACK5KO_09820 [Arachnia sp.]
MNLSSDVYRKIRSLRDRAERRRRRPPELSVTAGGGGEPGWFYLCPDEASPSGGVAMIYRHVEALRAHGRRAFVVHHRPGFSPAWFAHDDVAISAGEARLTSDDILIAPEWYGDGLSQLPRGLRTVLFNQNPYLTFDNVAASQRAGEPVASMPGLVAQLTVSRGAQEFLSFAFDSVPTHRVRPVVDPEVFWPGPVLPRRRIVYVERHRRAREREILLRLLAGRLPGWDIVALSGTPAELGEGMRQAPIALSLGEFEGFGLPAAEAIACGADVVGYSAFGGAELFDAGRGHLVPEMDLAGFAREVVSLARRFETEPHSVRDHGAVASDFVLATYTTNGLAADLARVVTVIEAAPLPA